LSRDPLKLRVFHEADALVLEVYRRTIARASAAEAHYLVALCERLGFLTKADASALGDPYERLTRSLRNLLQNVED